MPDYRRYRVPGGTYFFTVALAERGSDLLVREVDRLRDAARVTQAARPFAIRAGVVMPDHLHCVWTLPEGDADYSGRWGAIKARFSMSMRRAGFTPPDPVGVENGGVNPALRRKGEIGLWQPRFWERTVRGEEELAAYVRYVWMNPVKHGFVARPVDWPWSSFHRAVRHGKVSEDWGG